MYDSSDEEADQIDTEDAKKDPEQQLCKSVTPALHYAAFHGLSHISASLHTVESVQGLRMLFQSKLLNWIELMGWYHEVRIVMGLVYDLKTIIEATLSATELLVSINSAMSLGLR